MAGAGYKLFNTGDVLTAAQVNTYLMEQTVMVFADAAARTTALTGVVSEGMISYLKDTNAVEVYNGSAWVSSDDPNAIQNTIVDAKGDLISATAADTPARLAVGNNGETLVADSSATTGLRWQGNFAAGKNKVINGDMNIWQRGTTFTSPSSGSFTADRWKYTQDGNGTVTVSRQTFTPGTAPVAGYESAFFLRKAGTALGTSTTFDIQQNIEDVRTLAGQTVTLSFWAKADSARNLVVYVGQDYGSGGSSTTYPLGGETFSLTTSWVRYTKTFTMSSISGKTIGTSSFAFILFRNTASASLVFDLWGVQLEASNTATAFQTATGTLAGELAACQRYYQRYTADTVNGDLGFSGKATSTTVIYGNRLPFVPFRAIPTAVDFANVTYISQWGVGVTNVTAITIATWSTTNTNLLAFTTTGTTSGTIYYILAGATSNAYIGLSAEL